MRAFWYVLFVASLLIAYQSYLNSNNVFETQGEARNAVCAVLAPSGPECELPGDASPSGYKTGITHRTYQFTAKKGGTYLAECKRDYIFYGPWKCTARSGSLL